MALKLPNGRFRVQIRIKGHPTIDRVFDTSSEARAFEDAERHRIVNNVPLWSLAMTFEEAWLAYKNSLLFHAKRDSTQRTELVACQSSDVRCSHATKETKSEAEISRALGVRCMEGLKAR